DCQNTYNGQVVYGKDAFSDLNFMDKLMPAKSKNNWDDLKGFLDEVNGNGHVQNGSDRPSEPKSKKAAEPVVIDTRRSDAVEIEIDRPTPPFWGTKILQPEDMPLVELYDYLDLQALIAGQWQFRKPKDQLREEYNGFLEEKVYPILERWKQKVIDDNLLHPQVIYGYFPCQSEGNSLHLYKPEDAESGNLTEPIVTFEFPRQKSTRRLCIADFFAPKETGQIDVFPMHAVTVGEIATEYAKKLFDGDEYTDYLYFHGMAVQVAEAMAEWVHARIRRELGFGDKEPDNIRDILAQRYQGSRYSFGYPACPNIQDQYKQLELLGCDRINLYMDESEQLYPEQSTTAIIAYHPVAKYFTA
ncbi:MAG: vitamin B12 dependent-methionine synthase activation domain-containing protein, partial [Cyanobacteriota bacterium]|nr:vitamin B12 dependent-methionine synthase activation domain-containing protein [Cyanobacteriota bacterium]